MYRGGRFMGFFKKEECAICHKEVGPLDRVHIANKECICSHCFEKTIFDVETPTKDMTIEDIRNAMATYEANAKEFNAFNATKKVGGYLEIDGNKKQWLMPVGKNKIPKVYNYNDIVDFELLEDGATITKGGGLGKAIAGGILFGGVGAIVGGVTAKRKNKAVCNSLKIKITIRNTKNPVVYMNFIDSETKKNGFIYKMVNESAQECLSVLQLICDSQKSEQNNGATTTSNADEIMKYKNLLDAGAITQEEFEAKKRQLLGL
jgi:hypothetical protein